MGPRIIIAVMGGLLIIGCEKAPPPEPAQIVSKYAQQFIDAETLLSTDAAIGIFYIHPRRKRACNTMEARVSTKVYNGLEHRWEVAGILDIVEQNTAPADRRNIGTHPTLVFLYNEGPHRIDAISCAAYDGTVTTQYRNFAEFTVQPGEVAYIGDFTQARLAEGVDLYLPADNFDTAKALIGLDSPVLESKLSQADVTYFTFDNFDGKTVTGQEIFDNVGDSGDYFTLSQSLKTQAGDSLLPFIGYLPAFDVPPVTRLNVGKQKEALKQKMVAALDLTLLRLDMQTEFEAIIEAKRSYKIARNHINHRLAVANTERQLKGITNTYSNQAQVMGSRHSIAVNDRDAFVKTNDISKITKPLVTKEQKEARNTWETQLERMAFVLDSKFSTNAQNTMLRDRIQRIFDDYTPAKYASLEIELTTMAERQKKAITEIRRLRRLLKSAQANEEIILSELVSNFMQENLSENEAYHSARASFDKDWIEIFEIIGFIQ